MNRKKRILIVVGTRPNFIKVTQFKKFDSELLEFKIVHTGQHYDEKMASSFFNQLKVEPDFFLNVPPASANTQIAQMMLGLENVSKDYHPDLLVAVGDVNSAVAASIAANKLGIKLAHLEAGLRSFDRSMPEENNRIVTDNLSDFFFVTEQSGFDNLIKEGKPENSIHFVGNTMIDTLVAFDEEIGKALILDELSIRKKEYILMTMHRPSNVDSREGLMKMISIISHFSRRYKVVFPVHPRTRARLKEYDLEFDAETSKRLVLTEPRDYFGFQKLILECAFVITDSGGVQEETTFRRVPCFTLRPNTERPCTIVDGTNTLVPMDDPEEIIGIINDKSKKGATRIPVLWDGQATRRIVAIISRIC